MRGKMVSLANIIDQDPTLLAADKALEERAKLEKPRTYLGMSQIGDSCSRKLWYSFRWADREVFDSATLKRFEDGHRTEDLIINRLKLVDGLDIVASLPDGGQIRVVDFNGHYSGHLDGTITGLFQAPKAPHILEIKCVGDKKFAEFKKAINDAGEKKALRIWNPVYYAQAQAYMHYMGYNRHYIIVATAGGRDWVSARTEYDAPYSIQLRAKAQRIIDSQEPLDRISNSPTWFECKWCVFKGICHEEESPERNCRTCLHSTPIENGQWHCDRYGKILTPEEQRAGCVIHKYLPSLVPAEIIKADEKGITYKMSDGSEWYDGE